MYKLLFKGNLGKLLVFIVLAFGALAMFMGKAPEEYRATVLGSKVTMYGGVSQVKVYKMETPFKQKAHSQTERVTGEVVSYNHPVVEIETPDGIQYRTNVKKIEGDTKVGSIVQVNVVPKDYEVIQIVGVFAVGSVITWRDGSFDNRVWRHEGEFVYKVEASIHTLEQEQETKDGICVLVSRNEVHNIYWGQRPTLSYTIYNPEYNDGWFVRPLDVTYKRNGIFKVHMDKRGKQSFIEIGHINLKENCNTSNNEGGGTFFSNLTLVTTKYPTTNEEFPWGSLFLIIMIPGTIIGVILYVTTIND